MISRSHVSIAVVAIAMMVVNAGLAHGQLLEPVTASLTAPDGRVIEVTTGFVRVPELRDSRGDSSSTIDLAIVRLRPLATAARSTSAHVILAGGPGDSGTNLAMGLARQGSAALWQLFDGDVIGIDQRGTGRSRPNLASEVRYDLPLDKPGSLQDWLPRVEHASRRVAEEFRGRGIRLEAYNTQESADDVAEVGRALGYERMTLWGRSYGSHLALATVARHPGIVDRLVLVSPEGPNHTWKLPAQVDVVIRRLVERGATDLETNMRQVLTKLAAAPTTVFVKNPRSGASQTVVLGAFDVQWITANALGDPRLIAGLPRAFREMAKGNFERMAHIALLRRSTAGVASAMKHMMDLSSGATVERQQQIESEARDALLGNAINFPGFFEAKAWAPVIDLGEEFRKPVKSDIPTLLLVGDLDPRTPMINAREIATALPAAKVVVIENATHQFDVFGSPAILALFAQFLRGEPMNISTLTLPAVPFQ
jgi:pimeloyl-ACP methyl ester carboxylesterase